MLLYLNDKCDTHKRKCSKGSSNCAISYDTLLHTARLLQRQNTDHTSNSLWIIRVIPCVIYFEPHYYQKVSDCLTSPKMWNTLGSTTIRHQSDSFASDRWLIDVDLWSLWSGLVFMLKLDKGNLICPRLIRPVSLSPRWAEHRLNYLGFSDPRGGANQLSRHETYTWNSSTHLGKHKHWPRPRVTDPGQFKRISVV